MLTPLCPPPEKFSQGIIWRPHIESKHTRAHTFETFFLPPIRTGVRVHMKGLGPKKKRPNKSQKRPTKSQKRPTRKYAPVSE